ncbi:MAG: DUF1343 domain-containing protein [Planctomycetes bacterium]|nr:DUF1343 domain-containing protein [Planctomycetota bacterium]
MLATLAAAVAATAAAPRLPTVRPEDAGMSAARLSAIDRVVAQGLEAGEMPGCVVVVGRRGRLVWRKAYGHRQVEPEPVAMTVDTVFDMASLTKPIATAASIMLLVEAETLQLDDPVAKHIAEFAAGGKEGITVLQLLTHQSGLIPDNSLADYNEGVEKAWEHLYALKPHVTPGTKFVYSDVGYLVLGELVRRLSGDDVHKFSGQRIFAPLGMTETGFLPGQSLRRRAAPTEQRNGRWMRGEVHDPRAYRLGGIAGHAGLFATTDDLAVYAQMMLGRGQYAGVRILGEKTVAAMTRAYPVSSGRRGLGWDIKTGYSSNRGQSFSPQAFGHGGFTGTSLWIDPQREMFVIFLSNRLHPDGKGSVNRIAGRIGTIAADAVTDGYRPVVRTGIDVLRREDFRRLRGRRVGLITNHTGIDATGASTARLLHEAAEVKLVALFSPEHGLHGTLDTARIADGRDRATGLPVYSLYGASRRPKAETLSGIDTLVFDIQDIGTRFYTYISTMGYAMQAAAEAKIRFVVLDRPNPINGTDVAGPLLDEGRESFVGFHRLPVRHGMTIGELARMFREELQLDLDLQVVPVEGWRRDMFFDATGLKWVNPSPNMRSLTEALLYPGVGLLETTNVSVGRGTDTPFEVIGAPWIDGIRTAGALNGCGLPGVRFVPIDFTPGASKFAGERCGGVNIIITDRAAFRPLRTGLEIAHRLQTLYPDAWTVDAYDRLLANRRVLELLKSGESAARIETAYRTDLEAFARRRARYLLY